MLSLAQDLRFRLEEARASLSVPGARIRLPSVLRFATRLDEGHFHLRAELFLQGQASTRFRFPGETLDLGPGEILLVPAKVAHHETVLPGDAPFRNVVLYADEKTLSCHSADARDDRPRVLYPENLVGPGCGRVARWLEDAAEIDHDYEDPELAVTLVRAVLGLTLQLLDHPDARDVEPLPVVRCRRMIHEDLGNAELSVALLARNLGCSADYLSHLFRTVRGEKLTAYIEEQRMLRAAELLSKTALSCKEVAWGCGYANQSYFIRCFRKRWKVSPLEWRNSSGEFPRSQSDLGA